MPLILVVDDEALISQMLKDWLGELGCETAGPAYSVQSALRLIDGPMPIDGAILDVSLRDGRSYLVADTLRGRGIPFVFATGLGASVVDPRFKDALVLSKPFDFEQVRMAMFKLLPSHTQP